MNRDIPNLRISELNTDGIMVEFDEEQYNAVNAIVQEWQERTHFNMEEERIARYYAKDVNNFLEVDEDGSVKKKGGYLVRGIAPAGAFNVNNNAIIVAEAITEWFVNRAPPEDTINACQDVFKFQLIAKAGSKYREAYHVVDGVKQPVQKVNRVYAAKDARYGKLYKVKAENDMNAQIEMLPEHCLIDNTAVNDPKHTKIDAIDKDWYIALAKKRIDDFYGKGKFAVKNKDKGIIQERMDLEMATVAMKNESTPTLEEIKSMNTYEKLLHVRLEFLEKCVQKTGKNMQLKYMYFELDDIVPAAMPLFLKWRLIPLTYFPPLADGVSAQMRIANMDDPDHGLWFSLPFKEIDPIISSTKGTEVTNVVQRLGSAVTYYRRYLYMIALDIVEQDEMEAKTGLNTDKAETPAETPKPKAPATPKEREEIKQELTRTDGNADEMQLSALKAACEKFSQAGYKEQVTQIAMQTENYTKVSKADCEKLINRINEILAKKGA